MMASTLGWVAATLLTLILWRACLARLVTKFKIFYAYIAADLAGTIIVSLTPYRQPGYARWYWIIQFVTLFLGCTILWEMFERFWLPALKLRRSARIGQCLLLSLMALAAVRFAALEAKSPNDSNAFRGLEGDCHAAQAVFFIVIIFAVIRYGIPIGKNLKAIALGYGFYVLVSLVALTVLLYWRAGSGVAAACRYSQAVSFDAAAAIWLIGLWTPTDMFAPFPEQNTDSEQHPEGRVVIFGSFEDCEGGACARG